MSRRPPGRAVAVGPGITTGARTVRVACVGLGYWGPNLLRVLSSLPTCEVVAACDSDEKPRGRIQLNYPWLSVVGDYQTVLENPDVDAIVLATPAARHFEHACLALRHAKHVLVEKPLALSLRDAIQVLRIARESNRVLMVGHVFQYNSAVRYVKQMIERGDLGNIYYIYSQRLNLGKVRDDLDVFWNFAPHDISILNLWMGASPISVSAHGVVALPHRLSDAGFVFLEFPEGIRAHIQVSWLDPNKVRRMTVVGSRKMLVYDDVDPERPIQIFDRGVDLVDDNPSGFGEFKMTLHSGDIHVPKIRGTEPLRVECEHFIDCIREGRVPDSGGKQGAEVVAVLEAITASMNRGGIAVPVEALPEDL